MDAFDAFLKKTKKTKVKISTLTKIRKKLQQKGDAATDSLFWKSLEILETKIGDVKKARETIQGILNNKKLAKKVRQQYIDILETSDLKPVQVAAIVALSGAKLLKL